MKHEQILEMETAYQVPTYAKIPVAIERGEGPFVWDAQGNRYIDFYGGHCVTILGHSPKPVVEAIKKQAETLLFYSNIVYNSTRAKAARLVAESAPAGLNQVFFCNSGTEANETALKVARKATGKSGILAMEGGFHGRTLGSLAVTHGPKYRDPYQTILPPTEFVPFGDAEAVQRTLSRNPDIAAVILEPIQSMAGVRMADSEYFQNLEAACAAHGALLIFDEIQTGCGRTGRFSYAEMVGITPSIITLAKSLGSGIPVGATVVHEDVVQSIEPGDQGSTFGGGMLAMAAVVATLETIKDEDLASRALTIERRLVDALKPIAVEIRGSGCLLGIEVTGPASDIVGALRSKGLLVGGSGDPNTIRLMPPVNCPESVLDEAIAILVETFEPVSVIA
ncbi:MAG: aspartate aminotransferase family protein [Rhodothermia bacterium]